VLLAAAAPLGSVMARSWPTKPVTIVVPFPAGGGTGAFARPLIAVMIKNAGKQFVNDNKGGAGGTVGASLASHATPDGDTFSMGAVHQAIAPSMYPKLDHNIETDFIPAGPISSLPQVTVVNPPWVLVADLKGLLDYPRKNPGKLNDGPAGNGTSHHRAPELFKLQPKAFITHIPYCSSDPARQDPIAGQVDLVLDGLGSSARLIKNGRIKALAIASDSRAPGFPDVPSSAEADVPSHQVVTWYGLGAPEGTAPPALAAMPAELKKALASAELKTIGVQPGRQPTQAVGAGFWPVSRQRGQALCRGGQKLRRQAGLRPQRSHRRFGIPTLSAPFSPSRT
jgi:tripartite-type tricarboxylate transporter receptor subunit TctC